MTVLQNGDIEFNLSGGDQRREDAEVAKSVITIPASRSRYTADEIGSCKKRRVVAYARVSTDHEEQLRGIGELLYELH